MTAPRVIAQCAIEGTANCQPFEPTELNLTMLSDLSIPPFGVAVADDFLPAVSEVTQVCVWGVYIDSANCDLRGEGPGCDCINDVTDRFRVTVYTDAGGFPGSTVGTSTVSTVNRGAVDSEFSLAFVDTQMYELQLLLDTPISGLDTSGTVYWLEVVNNTTESETCNWHWSFGTQGNAYSAVGTSNGYVPGSGRTGDMAFCLNGDISAPPTPQAACCLCPDVGGTCSVDTLDACTFNAQWNETQPDCTNVTCPSAPANDWCADAIPVTGDVDITTDTGCSSSDDNKSTIGSDIWYAYTVNCTGFVVVSMCATGNGANSYDSILAVYRDIIDSKHCPCPVDPGFSRISNFLEGDEGCSGLVDSGAGIFRSDIVYPGDCLTIRAGGWAGAAGRGHLSIGCEPLLCTASSQPSGDGFSKNRFLSIQGGDPGRNQAFRITPASLPAGLSQWEGSRLWIREPHRVCENSGNGLDVEPPDCGPAPGLERKWFWAAPLGCSSTHAHFMDWHGACVDMRCSGGLRGGETCLSDDDCVDVVHVYHEVIAPGGIYDIQLVESGCEDQEVMFSPQLSTTQPRWGDIVSDCTGCPCGPSDGSVDVVTDVVSLIKKFSNQACAPIKTRADLEPGILDFKVNITDVLQGLRAFTGEAYPFAPELDPC